MSADTFFDGHSRKSSANIVESIPSCRQGFRKLLHQTKFDAHWCVASSWLAWRWMCNLLQAGFVWRITPVCKWRYQAIIDWSWCVVCIAACCHSVKLCALAAQLSNRNRWNDDYLATKGSLMIIIFNNCHGISSLLFQLLHKNKRVFLFWLFISSCTPPPSIASLCNILERQHGYSSPVQPHKCAAEKRLQLKKMWAKSFYFHNSQFLHQNNCIQCCQFAAFLNRLLA